MRPFFLIGFMGSGKSTMGRLLSAYSGLQLIDMDKFIEARFHATVKEIFAQRGEQGFRLIERAVLHEIGEFSDVVIATGGGTPLQPGNMEYMNSAGTTIFLDSSIDSIYMRLSQPKALAKRPLLAGLSPDELRRFITDTRQARLPFYEKAQLRFDSSRLDSPEQREQSCRQLALLLGLEHVS